MFRPGLLVLLLSLMPIAAAEVIWCDPSIGRCFRADSMETLLIPSNHCVLIKEIDGVIVDAIACNRHGRNAPVDLSPGNSLRLPDPWRVFPALEQQAQALAQPTPEARRPDTMRLLNRREPQ